MNCEHTQEQLGRYLDGELAEDERRQTDGHLAACRSCTVELDSLRAMISDLAAPEAKAPEALWASIERRLESEPQQQPVIPFAVRLRSSPWAMAAGVVLAVGLGLLGLAQMNSSAKASSVDFSVLLDSLSDDATRAFGEFVALYDGVEGTTANAKRHAPDLNFEIPQVLPRGFELDKVYFLRFGKHPGIAARYVRGAEFLGAIFHRPVRKEDFGTHRDHPCVIGQHRGHMVSVGEWKLVHLTDPTTCHCVLSRLDETADLPDVMRAIAPNFAPSSAHSHHD